MKKLLFLEKSVKFFSNSHIQLYVGFFMILLLSTAVELYCMVKMPTPKQAAVVGLPLAVCATYTGAIALFLVSVWREFDESNL
jgi:hypothetical protein